VTTAIGVRHAFPGFLNFAQWPQVCVVCMHYKLYSSRKIIPTFLLNFPRLVGWFPVGLGGCVLFLAWYTLYSYTVQNSKSTEKHIALWGLLVFTRDSGPREKKKKNMVGPGI